MKVHLSGLNVTGLKFQSVMMLQRSYQWNQMYQYEKYDIYTTLKQVCITQSNFIKPLFFLILQIHPTYGMHWKRWRCQESGGRSDAANVATLPNKHLMRKNTYWGNMPNPFLCHAHFADECAIIYPILEVTSVGVKRSNFLPERMIFLFPLLVTTRKRKEAAMIPARKEMSNFNAK